MGYRVQDFLAFIIKGNVHYNSLISATVNGALLNFGKRYKDDLRVIFDQSPKLHLGLDALSNQKILKGI